MHAEYTDVHRAAFEAPVSGVYSNLALFSHVVDGKPARLSWRFDCDGAEYMIKLLFAVVRPGMVLADRRFCQPLIDTP